MDARAVISEKAKIGKNVKIGPFCVIGENVELKDNVELKSHVVIEGFTTVDENTVIYPFASIGTRPQDLKYKGEPSEVLIGKNNVIREYVTIQPGTAADRMETIIGDNCLIMLGVHIAHDCIIGNNVILANYVNLAGHVVVGDYANIGGLSAVQQRVRIGAYSMIGGMSAVDKDLIPFGLATCARAHLEGLNLVGLRRKGFDNKHSIEATAAIKKIFTKNTEINFNHKVEAAATEYKNNPIIQTIIHFLLEDKSRSFCGF